MAQLTVREKEHWKRRVEAKIDKKIESIESRNGALMSRVREDAKAKALVSLGLRTHYRDLDTLKGERDNLEKRETTIKTEALAAVRGVTADKVDVSRYGAFGEVERAVGQRERLHRDELLAEYPAGQEILRLQKEKEELLDTVWLATSCAQVKELWVKVMALLGEESSELQKEALSMSPMDDA